MYPKIKEINYIGRYYHKKNSKIFNQLNNYVENRRLFSKNSLSKLKRLFKELVKKNDTILLSNENWVIPYQKNNKTDKIEIISQFEKLKRLRKFMNDINISYKFFIIDRDKSTLIKSLFATLQERITKLFGYKNLEFKNFIYKFKQKDNDYENIKLFFDIINFKKIEKTLQKRIKIFNYNLIKNDPEKFLIHLGTFMNVKIDISLADKLRIKTRVSESKNGNYIVKKPNFLFKLIKLITPKKIKMLLKKYSFYSKALSIMSNDTGVSYNNKKLKNFLEKIHKN